MTEAESTTYRSNLGGGKNRGGVKIGSWNGVGFYVVDGGGNLRSDVKGVEISSFNIYIYIYIYRCIYISKLVRFSSVFVEIQKPSSTTVPADFGAWKLLPTTVPNTCGGGSRRQIGSVLVGFVSDGLCLYTPSHGHAFRTQLYKPLNVFVIEFYLYSTILIIFEI